MTWFILTKTISWVVSLISAYFSSAKVSDTSQEGIYWIPYASRCIMIINFDALDVITRFKPNYFGLRCPRIYNNLFLKLSLVIPLLYWSSSRVSRIFSNRAISLVRQRSYRLYYPSRRLCEFFSELLFTLQFSSETLLRRDAPMSRGPFSRRRINIRLLLSI